VVDRGFDHRQGTSCFPAWHSVFRG